MNKFDQAVIEAKKIMDTASDPVHASSHSQSVENIASEIVREHPEANWNYIRTAIWFHDTGRTVSEDHDSISVSFAEEVFDKIGMNKNDAKEILKIIETHGTSYGVKNLEEKIMYDADKIDLFSIYRWEIAIKAKANRSIELAIELLPQVKNNLFTKQGMEIYKSQVKKFIEFIEKTDIIEFEKYKLKLLKLEL